MRSLLLALLLSLSGPAWAFDADSTLLQWGQADYECRIGETQIGTQLTSEQSDFACGVRSAAELELMKAGYCFDRSEQSWNSCSLSEPIPTPRPDPTKTAGGEAYASALIQYVCAPTLGQFAPIQTLFGMDYHTARASLVSNGWKPKRTLDYVADSRDSWALDVGYTELQLCRGTGFADCHFNLQDTFGNTLHIVTHGDEGASVARYFFLCEGSAPDYLEYVPMP